MRREVLPEDEVAWSNDPIRKPGVCLRRTFMNPTETLSHRRA
jgi:hypothetical protein